MTGGLEDVVAFLRSVDPLCPGARLDPAALADDLGELAGAINEALGRLERERRESGRRRLAEHERERREVAHDLHATIGQLLTAALLQLDQAEHGAADRVALGHAREATQQALDTAGSLSRRLAPLIPDELGLEDALAGLVASVTRSSGLRVRRDVSPQALESLDRETALVVARVAQQRLATIVRHGTADAAALTVRPRPGGVELVVAADGPVEEDEDDVAVLREWALLVGGRLALASSEDHSTVLVLFVPVADGAGGPLSGGGPTSRISR